MATSLINSYLTTQSISRTDLVGLTSISFIRPQRINFSVVDTKPSTKLYAFFDGKSVDAYVNGGAALTTTAAGTVSGYFDIPPMTFNTGTRTFLVQDSPVYDETAVPGNSVGTAQADFSAAGILKTFKQTTDVTNTRFNTFQNTIVNRVENNIVDAAPPPPPVAPPRSTPPPPAPVQPVRRTPQQGGQGGRGGDPLAQTFFTYGVKGGCFITAISIFFQSKDNSIPVTIQIREVTNGYPSEFLVSEYANVSLAPASVFTSGNASLPTKFTFVRPIYLPENKEFCFVLLANSNSYNLWTSEFGKQSVETGKIIFEQPYIGTMFKSENNITWTAEQTEDIKFIIHKATFSTASKEYTLRAYAPTILIPGFNLSTTSGASPTITATFETQHGHKTGDKIVLTGLAGAVYRGITSAQISNSAGFSITVIDSYKLSFVITGATATSAGLLETTGFVNDISVTTGGTGYSNSPTITITGGTGATATAVVTGGVVVGVTITNVGSGFVSKPVVTITDSTGSGASLEGVSEALFVVSLNKQYQNVVPLIDSFEPTETKIVNSLKLMNADYTAGTHEEMPLNEPTQLDRNSVLLNTGTESVFSPGSPSTEMKMRFESTNPNVSPMFDVLNNPRLRVNNFIINDSSNSTSELDPTTGTAQSKYISKIIKIETPSKAAKIFVEAASVVQTSFDVFIRTSISDPAHISLPWVKMNCDVERNMSKTWTEYKDYEFYIDGLNTFDSYDVKIVLYSTVKYLFPKIGNYRAIILAS